MSAMPAFSHHHHHHTPPSIGPLSVSPTHTGSSAGLSTNTSHQCLMQSNGHQPLQSQQLQRDLISPSPYQCHMSVRSGPLTPTASSMSASSLAAAAAAAYDSLGLVVGGTSGGGSSYNSARHSPCSPQSGPNLYPLNSHTGPFGLSNSTNGTTGRFN